MIWTSTGSNNDHEKQKKLYWIIMKDGSICLLLSK